MVRIGIIGVGRIGTAIHLPGLKGCKDAEIVAMCDVDKEALKKAAKEYGVDDAHMFTNYEDLINCPDVDAVEVCTPNYLHCEMAAKAAKAGKPVNIEKPLGINIAQAIELEEALKKYPVPNMMCFSYRFKKAVRYAKEIIDNGMIGKIININVAYLQSGALIPGRKLEWRFEKKYAGSGALGDLGVHLIDMAMFLFGDIERVSANMDTVVKERPNLSGEGMSKVDVDDYCNFIVQFKNGGSGLFTMNKCAIGHGNTIIFDVYGTEGVISFNLNRPDELNVCVGKIDREGNGMHKVTVPARFSCSQEQTFIDMVNGKEGEYLPTIKDGIRCQKVLDAVLLSAETNQAVTL